MSVPGICWASPLPPTRSGVADYAAELLPHLAGQMGVKVRRPPGWSGGQGRWAEGLSFVATNAPTPAEHVHLYHLGNNPYHLWIAHLLRRWSGVVVLHDTVVHHLLVEEAAADGEWGRLAGELEAAHPGVGGRLAVARGWGYVGPLDAFMLPARAAFLRLASALIVHSERARQEVSADCPNVPIRRVPLAVAALPGGDREAWRRRLGVRADEVLAAHLGFLTPAKGMGVILQAMAALKELEVPFRLVVVGEGSEASGFRSAVQEAGLGCQVVEWGYASVEDLGGITAAADLGLVPRYPTAGETSAAALRFLASGTPVLVAGYGQFLELPPEAALRIAPGRAGVADMVRHVARLASDAGLRRGGRIAARRAWDEGGHEPEKAAAALATALREIAGELAR